MRALDPMTHAERVTGRCQSAKIDLWTTSGFAAAVSDVDGPHVYAYGELPWTTVAITLYDVRRHVLIENGKVRRDGRVHAGRFRIGAPGRDVLVDASPDVPSGKLLILYLSKPLLDEISTTIGRPVQLLDVAWDTEDPLLAHAAQRIADASSPSLRSNSLLAEQMAYSLALHLADLYDAQPAPLHRSTVDHPEHRMRVRVVDILRGSPSHDLSLGQLSREFGMTPSGFIRAFKRSTGKTPHQFILEERVRIAQEMLAQSKLSVAEIALSAGFSSQSHLGAAFRSIVGDTPGRWRASR